MLLHLLLLSKAPPPTSNPCEVRMVGISTQTACACACSPALRMRMSAHGYSQQLFCQHHVCPYGTGHRHTLSTQTYMELLNPALSTLPVQPSLRKQPTGPACIATHPQPMPVKPHLLLPHIAGALAHELCLLSYPHTQHACHDLNNSMAVQQTCKLKSPFADDHAHSLEQAYCRTAGAKPTVSRERTAT